MSESEIKRLESQKVYYAAMSRLHDLQIKKIKLQQNIESIDSEISKTDETIKKFKG